MLKIGRIEYANCTPIFQALQELYPDADYRYETGVPAKLNAMLAAGSIHVCPSSSIEFASHHRDYLILPDISISSNGPVASVMLFSSLPVEELSGKTVLLTSDSATSVNLLKILLKRRFGCGCTFEVTSLGLEQALEQAPALLQIGDTALKTVARAEGVHVYDLGELWREWTGLPFVFALWLTTRRAADSHGSELRRLSRQLLHAKQYALEHLERIADSCGDVGWIGRLALLDYWSRNISYDLRPEQIEGLQRFYRYAAELGLVEQAPELAFLEGPFDF